MKHIYVNPEVLDTNDIKDIVLFHINLEVTNCRKDNKVFDFCLDVPNTVFEVENIFFIINFVMSFEEVPLSFGEVISSEEVKILQKSNILYPKRKIYGNYFHYFVNNSGDKNNHNFKKSYPLVSGLINGNFFDILDDPEEKVFIEEGLVILI